MSDRPHERRTMLERQWPWLVGAAALSLATAGLGWAIDTGRLAEYELFPALLRGYTATGIALGTSSTGFTLLAFAYSLRKRTLQESLPMGTMAGWLWGHVYLGLLSLVLALFHAGYGSVGFELSTGKVLLALLAVLVGAGLLWRVIYATVPARAAREVGHYSRASSRARAQLAQVEIEKLSAGRSPEFRALASLLETRPEQDTESQRHLRALPAIEHGYITELLRLSRERHAAIAREQRQVHYGRLLQGLRLLHVPVSLAFLLLLPLHVALAFDAPARLLPLGSGLGSTLGGFHGASQCESCHQRIVSEWRSSMHAHALSSPVMVAQNNQVQRALLGQTKAPDPRNLCVNCHAPLATALSKSSILPFAADDSFADAEALGEGVSCSVCHQWDGEPKTAGGGLSAFQQGLVPGRTFFGPRADAVGNAFHRSEKTALFRRPSELCRNCHSVEFDRDGDGKFSRGSDLVLQTLFEEWEAYEKQGGRAGCVDCHMPIVSGTRAAESAHIPLEQDGEAPPRQLRSHAFVAVDYPLDAPRLRDALRPARDALLRTAATLTVSAGGAPLQKASALSFELGVTNVGAGHDLPGGFAFVRQMWLEVSVFDASGALLASSGRLGSASDDLCDASIIEARDNPMRRHLAGCSATDLQLANFQQMLVSDVEPLRDTAGNVLLDRRGEPRLTAAPGAVEAVLQHLLGGPVPRLRAATATPMPTLVPGERRDLRYSFTLPSGARPTRLVARLLFRALPPYFLRALAENQRPEDGPALSQLAANLELAEMTRLELGVTRSE